MTAERVFLGWDRPLLHAAADHLVAAYGDALSELLIAVPGGAAQRRLLELLADRLPGGRPPTIVTAGRLVDQLVEDRGQVAGRAARNLAWAGALADLPADRLAELIPEPPAPDDVARWRGLGAMVRALHGKLAGEDLDFRDVIAPAGELGGPAEAQRWQVLDLARRGYQARLLEDGVVDPHESRRDAVREGRLDVERLVALVGVVEAGGLQRAVLERLVTPPMALVFAPASEASRFDPWGLLVRPAPDAAPPDVPVDPSRWFVEDRPADQAERVVRILARQERPRSADEITVGLLDPSVGPALGRRLREHGVRVRDVAGTPLPRTAPVRLVAAVAAWVDGQGIDEFAALLRHPDVSLVGGRGRCLITDLDDYRAVHLPTSTNGPWRALGQGVDVSTLSPRERRDIDAERDRRTALQAASQALHEQLGALLERRPRPLHEWMPEVRAWLRRVYGARTFAAGSDAGERFDARALQALARALDDLSVASGWRRPVSAGAALSEVAAAVSGEVVAPAADDDAVELLGWLELPLDDAPLLIVTGVNDGRLPEPVGADRLLPESLATALGLPDDSVRLHRDAFLLTATLHSRDEVLLVTGRRTAEGDPLRPSRLLFACGHDAVVDRVRTLVEASRRRPAPGEGPPPPSAPRDPPRAAPRDPPRRLSATAFGAWLRSPYGFYLDRVLRLERVDDTVLELDPMTFGTLAHDVLESFGREGPSHATAPGPIVDFLRDRLGQVVSARFGRDVQPAVAIQLQQLELRLVDFARAQAAWRADGWVIEQVEWEPDGGGVPFDLGDGREILLTGRIDRVDRHPDRGAWAVLDYKTGDGGTLPHTAHRRSGAWVDLQLPLYRELVRPLGVADDAVVELGYVNLSADPSQGGGFRLVPRERKPRVREVWDAALLADALERARQVARAILDQELFALGDLARGQVDDPLVRALAGLDLLDAAAPDVDDDTAEDGEEGGP